MNPLDNFIKENFLQDINLFYNKYQIKENFSLIGVLIAHLACKSNFIYEFFDLYIRHYKRQFAILELLATKQDLGTEWQVFNLVRSHITIANTNLTISHLVNLHNSYISQEIVNTLEKIVELGIRITNLG